MAPRARVVIPTDTDTATLTVDNKQVRLTNLRKVFWPERQFTKGDLLQYYADVSAVLLPHVRDRAMVMKRYPHGIEGSFFFMKRAPLPRPPWVRTCAIAHDESKTIDFPIVDDVATLLWLVNLGCIDLNQWYARCDAPSQPDYLHFDLDPGPGTLFGHVREAALIIRDGLATLGFRSLAKTSGSRGIHVYVPIRRAPEQKSVWTFAKALAVELASRNRTLLTTEYRVANRPRGRVLVDYNQNAWGRTLASLYSVRPTAAASVSTPITWDEVAAGVEIQDFRLDNVRARIAHRGDLWKPLLSRQGRADLGAWV